MKYEITLKSLICVYLMKDIEMLFHSEKLIHVQFPRLVTIFLSWHTGRLKDSPATKSYKDKCLEHNFCLRN